MPMLPSSWCMNFTRSGNVWERGGGGNDAMLAASEARTNIG